MTHPFVDEACAQVHINYTNYIPMFVQGKSPSEQGILHLGPKDESQGLRSGV